MAGGNDSASATLVRPSADGASAGGRGGLAGTVAPADPLSAVLHSVRLNGALFFVVEATSPWCVEVPPVRDYARIILPRAQHVLSYHVVVEGRGWASVPGVETVPFGPGDVILFPHGDDYAMRSAPDARPELDRAQTLDFFRALARGELPFVVREGGGGEPRARFICGFLGCDLRPFNPVLEGLPRLLRMRGSERGSGGLLDHLVALTLDEAQGNRPGGGSVGLRLSELLFVELLRRHAATEGAARPGWLAGLGDRHVGAALALLHDRPAEAWSVASLARASGLSRSVFSERFGRLVGEPPLRYLTRWRMQLAARLLEETDLGVAAIGERVGYSSESAFSRAFRNVAGRPPGDWRRRGAPAPGAARRGPDPPTPGRREPTRTSGA